jgi:hypothetical protein
MTRSFARTDCFSVQSIVTFSRSSYQFLRNESQILIPEHFDGAVVGFQRVVKGCFVLGQAQVFTSVVGLTDLLCKRPPEFEWDKVANNATVRPFLYSGGKCRISVSSYRLTLAG